MDKKKNTRLAFAALAAAPVAAVAAPAVQTPSFSCDAASAGGSVNWGDGNALVPVVGISQSAVSLQYFLAPLSCADGNFEETVKLADGALIIGFTDKAGTAEEFKVLSTEYVSSGGDKYSYFNTVLEPSKISPSTEPDFLGIKLDSSDSFLNLSAPSVGTGSGPVGYDIVTNKSSDSAASTPGFVSFDSPSDTADLNGQVTISLYSTPFVPSSVPEPATLGLLGTGLLGLGMRWRLRRK